MAFRRVNELAIFKHREISLCHRLIDRVPNVTIRGRTKLKDVIQEARKRKWKFAKKIVEGDQERREARLLNWKPDTKRPLGRPRTRWEDDFMNSYKLNMVGQNWRTDVASPSWPRIMARFSTFVR
uniref:Uncharacterized protein n=1 Tax=Bursaphelenchus xylophilus TaxID=6326 RepID=A0A1I7S0F8_BURXY